MLDCAPVPSARGHNGTKHGPEGVQRKPTHDAVSIPCWQKWRGSPLSSDSQWVSASIDFLPDQDFAMSPLQTSGSASAK